MRGTPAVRREPYDPALDIAFDEVLLDLARPAARVWTPNGRAVVIGIASKAGDEVELERARQEGIPVRRRFSGGAAVLLSPEVVCFGVVFPYAEYEDDEERDEQALLDVRIANVRFYARRAASGLPLFDKATAAPQARP